MSDDRFREIVKDRGCLKCGQVFRSRGPHNRICPKCHRINAKLGSIPEGVLQMQRGQKYHNGWPILDLSDSSGVFQRSHGRARHGQFACAGNSIAGPISLAAR